MSIDSKRISGWMQLGVHQRGAGIAIPNLVFELIHEALEAVRCICLSLGVRQFHGVHDVLELLHLLLVMGEQLLSAIHSVIACCLSIIASYLSASNSVFTVSNFSLY